MVAVFPYVFGRQKWYAIIVSYGQTLMIAKARFVTS